MKTLDLTNVSKLMGIEIASISKIGGILKADIKGGASAEPPADPVFDPVSENWYEAGNIDVTITCVTDGADIYYTLADENYPGSYTQPPDPTSSSTLYTVPVNIEAGGDASFNFKAIAIKNSVSSAIISKHYEVGND